MLGLEEKRRWIEKENQALSIKAQCQLIGIPRASYYYEPTEPTEIDLMLMRRIDEIYTQSPFYGSRKMVIELKKEGHDVNRKKMQRLMRLLELEGMQPGPNTSKKHPENKTFPYLLRNLEILGPLQVWSTDITFIRLPTGFVYLVAVMDWFSRLVLSHRLSNSLETTFCLEAIEEAFMKYGTLEIFNTDQGVQFTCHEFVEAILKRNIRLGEVLASYQPKLSEGLPKTFNYTP